MNDKDLIYIRTIADEGGISQAAKRLFISQPSLSQSLKRIEASLGVSLFKRTPKGLALTQEGEEYYRMAGKILNIYSSFENEIQNIKELKTGSVAVGATPHRAPVLFPEFLAEFHLQHPGIIVSVTEASTSELEELLLCGKLDLAIIRDPDMSTRASRFSYLGVTKDAFLLVMRHGHPAGAHADYSTSSLFPILDPVWLQNENFLLPEPTQRLYEIAIEILKKAGISTPSCSYYSVYMDTLMLLAAAGEGVAIVPWRYARGRRLAELADCYVVPKDYGVFWETSITTLKDSYQSRAAQLFIDEFSRHLQK